MSPLFRRKPNVRTFVTQLRSPYANATALVHSIDGPFIKLYEAGLFVASIATARILTFTHVNPTDFADQFNSEWVDFLIGSYTARGDEPTRAIVIQRLQTQFPVYRRLFLNVLDPENGRSAGDNAVQLIWELFTNCTGKRAPEGEGAFLRLELASTELVAIGVDIVSIVRE